MARVQFSDDAPKYPGLSLPLADRPTTAELAHACRYWRCTTQSLAAMMNPRSEEFNDPAYAQFAVYIALNRSRRPTTYAEAGELWLAGEDYVFITEPGDETDEADEGDEDPPAAPSDSASAVDGATATGRHSLTA